MRTRPIPKELDTWAGPIAVDVEATIAMLEESCPEDQGNDAYWQAVDLLDKNKDISYDELFQSGHCRPRILEPGMCSEKWERQGFLGGQGQGALYSLGPYRQQI